MGRRVLVIDDHPMIATAFTLAARTVDPAIAVDCVSTLAAAEERIGEHRYALILLDLMLPDAQGFTGLGIMRALRPDTPIALVTGREEPSVPRQAMGMGARGFIGKSVQIEDMVGAMRVLLEGGLWFPAVALTPDTREHEELARRMGELSVAQLKVLKAIAGGKQNKQIAFDLGLAEPTVKTHLVAIFRKLGVTNRTEAVLALQAFDGTAEARATAA